MKRLHLSHTTQILCGLGLFLFFSLVFVVEKKPQYSSELGIATPSTFGVGFLVPASGGSSGGSTTSGGSNPPGGGGGYTFTVDLKVSDNGYIDPVRYDAPVGNPFVPSGNDYVVTWLTNDTSTVNAGRPYCTRSGDNPVGNWSGRTQVNKSGAVNFNNVSDGLYTHTYSCTFLGQTASDSVTVDVGGFVATSDPNLSLVAVPSILNRGQSTRLTWEAVDAGSCMLTGTNGDSWSGTSGEELSSPITEQTLFTLTCDGGTTQASVIVNINPSFEEF